MQVINTYIHFPEKLDNYIDSAEQGKELIKDFQMSIDLADCEKGSSIYYSKSNKNQFFENVDAFEEYFGYFGGIDFKTIVNILFLEAQITPINEKSSVNCSYSVYTSNSTYLDKDFPILFFEALKKFKSLNEVDVLIILNLFNNYFSQGSISIIEDCKQNGKQIIDLPFVENFVELDKWLLEHRLPRSYNMDDNRHIENHPQSLINSHGKSPLIGGIGGKTNAADLLKNAVGDTRKTKDLMNYDPINEKYIWYEFENDNPQNQYHGYHLVKKESYEEDIKAIEKVEKLSKRLINILNYRNCT